MNSNPTNDKAAIPMSKLVPRLPSKIARLTNINIVGTIQITSDCIFFGFSPTFGSLLTINTVTRCTIASSRGVTRIAHCFGIVQLAVPSIPHCCIICSGSWSYTSKYMAIGNKHTIVDSASSFLSLIVLIVFSSFLKLSKPY